MNGMLSIACVFLSLIFNTFFQNYTPDSETQYIENKTKELLAVPDSVNSFPFDGSKLQSIDPQAYWLVRRMMLMENFAETSADYWAWMLAVNESIEEYNDRMGYNAFSVDSTLSTIEKNIEIYFEKYSNYSQPEINSASYIDLTLAKYRTIYGYYQMVEDILEDEVNTDKDEYLSALYYQEYKEWFNLNSIVQELTSHHAFNLAHYSASPMEYNELVSKWFMARLSELDIENKICQYDNIGPLQNNHDTISEADFSNLIRFYKEITQEDIMEEIVSDWAEKDYEYARELTDGQFDFNKITEIIGSYEKALVNWQDVRKQIMLMLAAEKQNSYQEITNQIQFRFYNDLLDIKKIRY